MVALTEGRGSAVVGAVLDKPQHNPVDGEPVEHIVVHKVM
jgi:hypothetical protein